LPSPAPFVQNNGKANQSLGGQSRSRSNREFARPNRELNPANREFVARNIRAATLRETRAPNETPRDTSLLSLNALNIKLTDGGTLSAKLGLLQGGSAARSKKIGTSGAVGKHGSNASLTAFPDHAEAA
jgi:hypothetical protein